MRKRFTQDVSLYDKVRKDILKKKLVEQLGGKCVECGSTEQLEFDHIDPSTKRYEITRIISTPSKLMEEIKLCQLLCFTCHRKKSALEIDRSKREIHGTSTAYKYCGPPKCFLCRKYMREYMRKYLGVKTPRK